MAKLVLGVFSNRDNAEETIFRLEDIGYNPRDISLVMREKEAEGLYKDQGRDIAGGAVTGAVTGGIVGALAGLLVATGVAPGLGILFFGGPIAEGLGLTGAAAAVASGSASGVVVGGLVGALVGFGIPRRGARRYEESVKKGGILVIVPARTGEEDEVRNILEDRNAQQVKTVDVEEGGHKRMGEIREVEERPLEYVHYHEVRRTRGKSKREKR